MFLAVTSIPQSKMHWKWGRGTVRSACIFLWCVKMVFYLPFWNQLITTRTTKERLCSNFIRHNCVSFIRHNCSSVLYYLLWITSSFQETIAVTYEPVMQHLLCHRQHLPPCICSEVNKCFAESPRFQKQTPSKNIITMLKQPWRVLLKWPGVPLKGNWMLYRYVSRVVSNIWAPWAGTFCVPSGLCCSFDVRRGWETVAVRRTQQSRLWGDHSP